MVVAFLSTYGRLTSTVNIVPSLMYLLFYMIVGIGSVVVSSRMRNTLIKIRPIAESSSNKLPAKPPSATAPSRPSLSHAVTHAAGNETRQAASHVVGEKIKRTLRYLATTGWLLLVMVALCAVLSTDIQFRSSSHLAIYMLTPLTVQAISFCDMRIISLSLNKFVDWDTEMHDIALKDKQREEKYDWARSKHAFLCDFSIFSIVPRTKRAANTTAT